MSVDPNDRKNEKLPLLAYKYSKRGHSYQKETAFHAIFEGKQKASFSMDRLPKD